MTNLGAQILADYAHVNDCISAVSAAHSDIASLMDAIEDDAESPGRRPDIVAAMARMMKSYLEKIEEPFADIVKYCGAAEMEQRYARDAAKTLADTEEGQALRDLSRDVAQRIEQMCAPAMRAIAHMQNQAAEIDARVQRFRDIAGCLRPIHRADRDPDKPSPGSLRATVEEARRPNRLDAAIERSREGSAWMGQRDSLLDRNRAGGGAERDGANG